MVVLKKYGFVLKTLFCSLSFLLLSHAVYAQYFDKNNSFIRQSIVSYDLDGRGFYVRHYNSLVDVVDGVKRNYAYDKKSRNLYVVTDNSNIVITLNSDFAKVVKRNKTIPQLKDKELEFKIREENALLEERFKRLNELRQQSIDDSIHKAYADSLEKVRKAELLAKLALVCKENYVRNHSAFSVPTGGARLLCSLCDKTFDEDSLFTFGICEDSIYFFGVTEGDLSLNYLEPHIASIPFSMANNSSFKYHYEAFKDSLTCGDSIDYHDETIYLGYNYYHDYLNRLKKIAPYGYVKDWDWDCEYSNVTMKVTFVNTNSKTLKYITVYFKVTNSVGDVRRTGCFKGTGPVEQGHSGTWDWDSSSYFVAGDASNMSITKIVITYMNGSTRVLTGNGLKFD